MDAVKRRLVYVADENDALLNELAGTSPTRQSRTTRLLIPLSPPASSRHSSATLSPLPRPLAAGAAAVPTAIDTALLVAYDGFLLTDGNGHFAVPHNAAQAASLREVLKACRVYLKQYIADERENSSASTDSPTSCTSSSTYREEDDISCTEDASDDSPPLRRHRVRTVALPRAVRESRSPATMTVAELKELLRQRGVPAVGNKAILMRRAQQLLQMESEVKSTATTEETEPAVMGTETPSENGAMRRSTAAASSLLSSPRSSQLVSPMSRTSTASQGLWDALVTAGTRLFRSSARTSSNLSGFTSAHSEDASSHKRRRNA